VLQHLHPELRAEYLARLDGKGSTERPIDEREASPRVRTSDDVILAVEQIAVARFVVGQLPLQILQLLDALFQAVAESLEAVDLAGLARPRQKSLHENRDDAGCRQADTRHQQEVAGTQWGVHQQDRRQQGHRAEGYHRHEQVAAILRGPARPRRGGGAAHGHRQPSRNKRQGARHRAGDLAARRTQWPRCMSHARSCDKRLLLRG
jgi:hypothetical protein